MARRRTFHASFWLPFFGVFAFWIITIAVISARLGHLVEGGRRVSHIGSAAAHVRSRLRPRDPSIPERCVADPRYVRIEESVERAIITDPAYDHKYHIGGGDASLAHPQGIRLSPAEGAAMQTEVKSFWKAFRLASNTFETKEWTVRTRDICADAFRLGFQTTGILQNSLYPEDWIAMYYRGFLRNPVGIDYPGWRDTDRKKHANKAHAAGNKARSRFSGTKTEVLAHAQCFREGQRDAREGLNPEKREGRLRGYVNGLRVGFCTKKMKETWDPMKPDYRGPTYQQRANWLMTCLDLAREMYGSGTCVNAKQPIKPPEDSPSLQERFMSVLGEAGREAVGRIFSAPTKPHSPPRGGGRVLP